MAARNKKRVLRNNEGKQFQIALITLKSFNRLSSPHDPKNPKSWKGHNNTDGDDPNNSSCPQPNNISALAIL